MPEHGSDCIKLLENMLDHKMAAGDTRGFVFNDYWCVALTSEGEEENLALWTKGLEVNTEEIDFADTGLREFLNDLAKAGFGVTRTWEGPPRAEFSFGYRKLPCCRLWNVN